MIFFKNKFIKIFLKIKFEKILIKKHNKLCFKYLEHQGFLVLKSSLI